jgi:hypothetical protein
MTSIDRRRCRITTPASISRPAATSSTRPAELVLIKNNPAYNEAWPRAVVPYQAVHGVAEPADAAVAAERRQRARAIAGRHAHGLVGTSSFYKRESFPGIVLSWSNTFDGLDAFNTGENGQSGNWGSQGADAGKYAQQRHLGGARGRHGAAQPSQLRAERSAAIHQPRRRTLAHPGRDSAAQVQRPGPTDPRSGRQPGHQLPRQARGRYAVHVPDARPQRHGAEHGADLAPGAAGRVARRLRRLPCAQPAAARVREHGRGGCRATRCST